MKIYLDIDDTLITNYISGVYLKTKPANHLKEFLSYMIENHDVYWLTTHCNGDATTAVYYMNEFITPDITDLIMKIKPTRWNTRKIEAINLEEDFLWFDDVLMDTEEKQLKEAGKLGSFVKVDLDKNPNILLEFIDKPACKAYVVDILKKSYILHIWTWPKFSIGWHKKTDSPNNKILAVRKF